VRLLLTEVRQLDHRPQLGFSGATRAQVHVEVHEVDAPSGSTRSHSQSGSNGQQIASRPGTSSASLPSRWIQ
jgi:hypothetical protein